MMGRIYIAYTVELAKAMRARATYAGPALVMALVLAATLLHPIARDDASDYDFIAYATSMALNLLGVVLLMVFCAGLISTELGTGTLRLVLVRPLRRMELYVAKTFLGLTYALTLTIVAAATAWGVVFFLGDLNGVAYGGEIIYTDREMRLAFALALLLNIPPQAAVVAYATMISSFTRSAAAAITAAIGIWLVVDSVKYALDFAPYVFSTYLESAWQVFLNRTDAVDTPWAPSARMGLLTSGGASALFLLIGLIALGRRDLTP